KPLDRDRPRSDPDWFAVTARLGSLLEAQLDNAEGIRHLMRRDPKTGQLVRVMGDAREIDRALKTGKAFWIYTKDPITAASTFIAAGGTIERGPVLLRR